MKLPQRPESFMSPFISKVEDVNKISDSLRFRMYRCPDHLAHDVYFGKNCYDHPTTLPQEPITGDKLDILMRREIDGIIYIMHRTRPTLSFRLYVAFDIAHSDSEYRYIDKQQLLTTLLDDMERQLSPHMLEDIHIEKFIPFPWSRFYEHPGVYCHAPSELYAEALPTPIGNTDVTTDTEVVIEPTLPEPTL